MKRWQVAPLLAIGCLSVATSAHAVRFRRPFNISVGVNYGFDNNGGGGCTDYGCGGVCYDGHSGTDFPLPLGTDVVAAADGVVSATNNGCDNYGGLDNTCGGRCGNYVRIDYADGPSTIYCHMQLNSIAVSVGDHVSCGQVIGRSASSGNSSGPHLHFGLRVGGSSIDPFAGSCSHSGSYWVDQGSYPHPMPSSQCEVVCECSPGHSESAGCGNCGTHSRSCGGDCHWQGWSACQGEGECAAGSTDSRSCCDCGSQTRGCDAQCHWQEWGECSGPDPNGGNDECDTQEPGICAEGRQRCVQGCRKCVRVRDPEAERCDELDNDCDGTVDDDFPKQMGDPPPKWAASLVDVSFPAVVEVGNEYEVWAVFRNDGRETWKKGGVWLSPSEALEGRPSELFHDTWRAYDVVDVTAQDVEPGATATFRWKIRVSRHESGRVRERFQLRASDGSLVRCPSPSVDMQLVLGLSGADSGSTATSPQSDPSGCGCGVARRSSAGSIAMLIASLALMRLRQRRCARAMGAGWR